MPPDPDAASTHRADPDPRFVLAAERTFLAWQRTALALVAVGLAAVELLPSGGGPLSTVFGLVLVVAGGAVSAGSFARHRAVGRAFADGRPVPVSPLPALLAVTTVVGAVLGLVFVVVAGG